MCVKCEHGDPNTRETRAKRSNQMWDRPELAGSDSHHIHCRRYMKRLYSFEMQLPGVCSVSVTVCAERGRRGQPTSRGGGGASTEPPYQSQTEHSGCMLRRAHYNLS